MPKKRLKTIAQEHNIDVDKIVELVDSKLPVHTITGTGYARWINEAVSYTHLRAHET